MNEPKLVWQTPFGATRPDGVTANRVPFDYQEATALEVLAWLLDGEVCDNCRGTGEVADESYVGPHDKKFIKPCPSCFNGRTIPADKIEAVFEYLRRVGWTIPKEVAEAAIFGFVKSMENTYGTL